MCRVQLKNSLGKLVNKGEIYCIENFHFLLLFVADYLFGQYA